MANVYFKRGSQAVLDAYNGSGYTEGAFYLTNDTNRLYFAQSSTNLVNLNQYIHFVANSSALPNSSSATLKDGDIYYLQSENILCIYQSGQNPPWVQINPDTRLTTNQNSIVTVDTPLNNNNAADVSLAITDSCNGTVVNTARGDFTIEGGTHTHVTVSGNTISIDSDDSNDNTTYTLGADTQTTKGTITLTPDSNGTSSAVDIVGDGNTINVVSTPATANTNATITISGVAGGITSITDGFDANGEYGIALGRTAGGSLETQGVTPTITYGASGGTQSRVFANGTATLDVYTTTQVDNLLTNLETSLDALKYGGVVDNTNASTLLVINPEFGVGTVYKAGSAINQVNPPVSAKIGDLIIAKAGTDSSVVWEVVPAGDDTILSISGSEAENLVTFSDIANQTTATLGTIEIDGTAASSTDAKIVVDTDVDGSDITFTITHGAHGTGSATTASAVSATYTQSGNTNFDVPIVTGFSLDSQGHVYDVTSQTYRFIDTHATISAMTTTVDASNNEGTVTLGFTADGVQKQGTFGITSSTLKVTADAANDNLVLDLEWGSF